MQNTSFASVLLVVAVLAVIVLLFALDRSRKQYKLEKRLAQQGTGGVSAETAIQSSLEALARKMAGQKDYDETRRQMTLAGFWKRWQADLFIVVRLTLLVVVGVAGLLYLLASAWPIGAHAYDWLLWLFVLFLISRVPMWALGELIKKRQRRIRLFIPKAIDLLTLALDCGISLESGLERVARAIKDRAPEVSLEFEQTRYEMLVIDRQTALMRLEKRSGVHEMEMLASALRQSIQYGIPLADTLRTIADEARRAQMAELDERAGKISADIGIPLILLILFPVIAIIAAPAVLQLMNVF